MNHPSLEDDVNDEENEDVLEAARAIRPYLEELVGPEANQVDGRLADILDRASDGDDVASAVAAVLEADEITADFLDEVLADARNYRRPSSPAGHPIGRG